MRTFKINYTKNDIVKKIKGDNENKPVKEKDIQDFIFFDFFTNFVNQFGESLNFKKLENEDSSLIGYEINMPINKLSKIKTNNFKNNEKIFVNEDNGKGGKK